MTTFRLPLGWNSREPGKRPDLDTAAPWLKNCCETTRVYWRKIHWATPPWADAALFASMRAIYATANPKFDHVDHIVPLKHELVCGLHVPWNLQVVPRRYNLAKSNNWWPDCPDHLCPERNLPDDMFGPGAPHQLTLTM